MARVVRILVEASPDCEASAKSRAELARVVRIQVEASPDCEASAKLRTELARVVRIQSRLRQIATPLQN